ncbi:MAG: hypothetical protein WCA15_02160 [Candidatus Acidiferrales bacterium]
MKFLLICANESNAGVARTCPAASKTKDALVQCVSFPTFAAARANYREVVQDRGKAWMIVPQYIFERTQGAAQRLLRYMKTTGSRAQGAEIRQRRCCLVILFSEAAAISTQDTTQKYAGLAQSSEVNQDCSEGGFIRSDS